MATRKWTKQEDQILIDFLTSRSIKSLINRLPNRTETSIKNRLRSLLGQPIRKQIKPKESLDHLATVNFRNVRSGFRKDIGIAVRSGWEHNVLEYLNYIGATWEYEPEIFHLEGNPRYRSYVPDIHILTHPDKQMCDTWIEIKGRVATGVFTKMRAFLNQHQDVGSRMYGICERNTKADRLFKKLGIPILFYYQDFRENYKDVLLNWEGQR